MLLHFRSIVNSGVPVAVHNDFLRLQVELQFGLSLDTVRPMSLYTEQGTQEDGSVLVHRSPWLHVRLFPWNIAFRCRQHA